MIAKCIAMLQNTGIGRNHHCMDLDVTSLKKAYTTLTNSLVCHVDDTDYERLLPKLHSLKELSRFENRSISLYDINRSAFLMKVDHHMRLLGFSDEAIKRDISPDRYHAMIHPDDLAYLYDAEIAMYRFLQSHRNHMTDFKLVCDYRVRRTQNNPWIRFLHQMAVFACDRDGNAWIMMILTDVLESLSMDALPRRFLIDTTNGRVCLFQQEQGIADRIITSREREILTLIAQGLDSESIADRLCISLHTVNNHRQNILRKTRTSHIAQATYYLTCIGML